MSNRVAAANSHRRNATSQPEETPNQQEWSSTSAGRRAGAGVPIMSVQTQYVTDKILPFISPPLWWYLFVPLIVRSAPEQSGFSGWPQETGCGVGTEKLQMKQINGGNWVEKLQISSKQFWESGDREWQGSVIIAESLFTGSEKTIALCVLRQLKKRPDK